MDRAVVALQQHLGDARGSTEISVNLKRRVQIPQVRQRRLREQRQIIRVRLFAVLQARPEVDDPRAAPARVPAAVGQAPLDGGASGLGKLGVPCTVI